MYNRKRAYAARVQRCSVAHTSRAGGGVPFTLYRGNATRIGNVYKFLIMHTNILIYKGDKNIK